jgi:hypothetical protein
LGVEGPRKQDALCFVGVFVAEVIELVNGLDAFGERLEPEVLTELDEDVDRCGP